MRYKDTLYFLSLKYCRNVNEAEDNVQDTFITIFKTLKKYNGKGSFEGWIKRIAINKAIDKFKINTHFKDECEVHYKEDTYVDTNNFTPNLEHILNAIQELPNQYRIVFNLYQLDNYSHKEIAKLLNITESTSKSNYHRAKQILKLKLSTYKQAAS